MTNRVRLLADDLTGALDAGVYFAGSGTARVGWSDRPDSAQLAHSIESRDLPPEQAVSKAAQATDWLLGAAVPFKKIDSRLRGNIALELQAVVQGARPSQPIKRLVIAPSLAAQGRIMSGGRLWSHPPGGTPQLEPVDLATELAALGISVTQMSADRVRMGAPMPDGISLWDAASDADLDVIASHGLNAQGPTVWCGSAGLAAALARQMGRPHPVRRKPTHPLLMLVGTAHPRMVSQVQRLRTAMPGAVVAIGPGGEGITELCRGLEQDHAQLAWAAPDVQIDRAVATRHVTAALGHLAKLPAPATAFVSGGATLLSLAKALNTRHIALDGIYVPGAPAGRLSGGRWDGVRLISRSGGFGGLDFLIDLVANTVDAVSADKGIYERF